VQQERNPEVLSENVGLFLIGGLQQQIFYFVFPEPFGSDPAAADGFTPDAKVYKLFSTGAHHRKVFA
jgi:hypothetical protein